MSLETKLTRLIWMVAGLLVLAITMLVLVFKMAAQVGALG